MEQKQNIIMDLTFQFALKFIRFCDQLDVMKKYVLSRQLFKSGTSIGANVREAQGAESKADFKHKCKIAYKEAEETDYWLMLCKESENYTYEMGMYEELQSIKRVLGKIIASSK